MTEKTIGKISTVKTTKTCQACAFFAMYNTSVIRDALEHQKASSTLVREYEAVYSGGGTGRCMEKRCSTPRQDWCPKWQQKEIGSTPMWPATVKDALQEPQFCPKKG